MAEATIKVFEVNDCDWVAAATLEDAMAFYAKECFAGNRAEAFPDGEEEVAEVTDEAMNRLKFRDDEFHDDDKATIRTFREELQRRIDAGDKFPQFFASTEY
jgi:hypothetical protein